MAKAGVDNKMKTEFIKNMSIKDQYEYARPGMHIRQRDAADVWHIAEIVEIENRDDFMLADIKVKNAVTEHGEISKMKYWGFGFTTELENIKQSHLNRPIPDIPTST